MRICIYANDVPNWHKRDHLISRRTSTVAQFRIPIESCEVSTSQNKALINAFHMSAPLADDVQTSLGAGLRLQRYNKKCKCASIANNIFKKDRLIYLIIRRQMSEGTKKMQMRKKKKHFSVNFTISKIKSQ